MKKEMMFISLFGILCVLAGVFVGAGIVKNLTLNPPVAPEGALFLLMEKKLNLSEEQKDKIKVILESMRHEIDMLGESVRGTIKDLKMKSDKEIMAVLTPDQQKSFEMLIKDMRLNSSQLPPPPGAGITQGPGN